MESMVQFLFSAALVIVALIVWLMPVILIAKSPRTEGTEKLLWVLITVFLCWFAWIVYLLIAPITSSHPRVTPNRQY